MRNICARDDFITLQFVRNTFSKIKAERIKLATHCLLIRARQSWPPTTIKTRATKKSVMKRRRLLEAVVENTTKTRTFLSCVAFKKV